MYFLFDCSYSCFFEQQTLAQNIFLPFIKAHFSLNSNYLCNQLFSNHLFSPIYVHGSTLTVLSSLINFMCRRTIIQFLVNFLDVCFKQTRVGEYYFSCVYNSVLNDILCNQILLIPQIILFTNPDLIVIRYWSNRQSVGMGWVLARSVVL